MKNYDINPLKNTSMLIDLIKNPTNYEILMLLFMYHEISLKKLTNKISKSKSTIHRHLKKLIENGLVIESKEKKVRSHIKAKYYSINRETWSKFTSISPEQFELFDEKQKIQMYHLIIDVLIPTIIFSIKSFTKLQETLENLKISNDKDIQSFMEPQDLHLNMNFLSKPQYEQYIKLLNDFSQKFIQIIIEEETKSPNAEKPFLLINTIIPFKKY